MSHDDVETVTNINKRCSDMAFLLGYTQGALIGAYELLRLGEYSNAQDALNEVMDHLSTHVGRMFYEDKS